MGIREKPIVLVELMTQLPVQGGSPLSLHPCLCILVSAPLCLGRDMYHSPKGYGPPPLYISDSAGASIIIIIIVILFTYCISLRLYNIL